MRRWIRQGDRIVHAAPWPRSRLAITLGLVASLALLAVPTKADGWTIETVDSDGGVGLCSSIALDGSGYPHISYYASFHPNRHLKYAYQDALGWHIETVDTDGHVGRDTSIALDANGYPHISYRDVGNDALKYAYQDAAGWHIETVDSGGNVGEHSSIALDGSGYSHISYYARLPDHDLKHAYQDSAGWHIETVDTEGNIGLYSSIALDAGGYSHISYRDSGHGDLKYAYQDAAGWHIETVDSGGDVGSYTSIALDAGGRPHISYWDWTHADLKYACQDHAGWHTQTVDNEGFVGKDTSIALDASGYPHISYQGIIGNGDLKYAYQDVAGWHIETVDSEGNVGGDTSIALDASGYLHISYHDRTNYDLKYAHGTFTIAGTNPPTAAFTYTPATPAINDVVAFNDTSTDTDGVIVAWEWMFGDGGISTLQNPTHQYTNGGMFTVTLTVTDNDGAVGKAGEDITIRLALSATVERPAFLGPEPLHYELMRGGKLILTYVLLDSEGNPLPNVQVELNDECVLTNDDGMFRIPVDEDDLTSFGTPVGPTGYMFQPIARVTGYSIENLPTLFIDVLPREWDVLYSVGGGYFGIVLSLKGDKSVGFCASVDESGVLTLGRAWEQGGGLYFTKGVEIGLGTTLGELNAGISAELLAYTRKEDAYEFTDALGDLDQTFALGTLLLDSALATHRHFDDSPHPLNVAFNNPIAGFVIETLSDMVLPHKDYRIVSGVIGGVRGKVFAGLRFGQYFTDEELAIGHIEVSFKTGIGAEAEGYAQIGMQKHPIDGADSFNLAAMFEGFLGISIPFGILDYGIECAGGWGCEVKYSDDETVRYIAYDVYGLSCEIPRLPDRKRFRLIVPGGRDSNDNGIEDLVEITTELDLGFGWDLLHHLVAGSYAYFSNAQDFVTDLERIALEKGIALDYEVHCLKERRDFEFAPKFKVGAGVAIGLGFTLEIEDTLHWLEERGVWFDGVRYPSEKYEYNDSLGGDARSIEEIFEDALAEVWNQIVGAVGYVQQNLPATAEWVVCGVAGGIFGPVVGTLCLTSGAGGVAVDTIGGIVSWLGETVESQNGEILAVSEAKSPTQPVYWEGILAVGGFHSLQPDGLVLAVPALLTMTYDETRIPSGFSEADLNIFAWDSENGMWIPIGADKDTENNELVAQVTTFTTYVVGIDIAPNTPWELTATGGEQAVTLSWISDSEADLSDFLIYRSEVPEGPYERLFETPRGSTTYLDTPQEPGTYYYVVTSLDTSGNESTPSEYASAQVGLSGYTINYVVAHWVNGALDPNDSCEISLDQILQAIAWWADDTEVPQTGGQKINLDMILDLISKWADATCIDQPYESKSSQALRASVQMSPATLKVERLLSSTEVVPGQSITVVVKLDSQAKFAGLALDERLPDGWSITPVESSGATPRSTEAQWLWLEIGAGETRTVTYEVQVPYDAPLGRYELGGVVRSEHPALTSKVGGDTTIEVVPGPPLVVHDMTHYPNPVTGVHTVTFEAKGESIAAIRASVFDLSGRRVFQSNYIEGNSMEWHLQANNGEVLANGVYLYVIEVLGLNGELVRSEVRKLAILR